MIALDTNVLVRFLVRDDARQSNAAAALIERSVTSGDGVFISDVVICETAWVLAGSYKVARAEIVRVFTQLLRAQHVSFTSIDQIARALDAFVKGKGDLADYFIREHARTAGCEQVATFDKDLLRESGFASP